MGLYPNLIKQPTTQSKWQCLSELTARRILCTLVHTSSLQNWFKYAASVGCRVGALLFNGKWEAAARLILAGPEEDRPDIAAARAAFLEKGKASPSRAWMCILFECTADPAGRQPTMPQQQRAFWINQTALGRAAQAPDSSVQLPFRV